MTEAEWLSCADPAPMVALLGGRASNRKLRLYGCRCVDRVRHLLADPRSRAALDLTEEYAEGRVSKNELSAAQSAADRAAWPWGSSRPMYGERGQWRDGMSALAAKIVSRPSDFREKLAGAVLEAAQYALVAEFGDGRAATRGRAYQCGLVRCIFGNPFRPVLFEGAWRTADAVGLARGIYEDRAFDRLPLLADALMDAGCDSEEVLAHCRGAGPHARGCWVVDLVLSKQ